MREQTLLSREILAKREGFLDWDSQPAVFKTYPHFLNRIDLSVIPELQWLYHSRRITDEQRIAQKPYLRLNVPSAGNLHPIEIYVQLRNIPGLLSGIYHLESLKGTLTMIREIGSEGVEPYLGMDKRFSGAIVMISIVPFRSFWKYGLRSWRYLYLDLGHQIATLNASVRHFGLELSKMSPSVELSTMMGMGDEEHIAAVYAVGSNNDRPVKTLKTPLMRVSPTDYFQYDSVLADALKTDSLYCDHPIQMEFENFLHLNETRRSAREFIPGQGNDVFLRSLIRQPHPERIEPLFILFQAQSMQPGIYRNGECIREGDFKPEIVRLLLDQRFIGSADMVALIYAEHFDAASHIEAGIFAQYLYLACEAEQMACSGIGAFFDDDASAYSPKDLIYAVAIGGK